MLRATASMTAIPHDLAKYNRQGAEGISKVRASCSIVFAGSVIRAPRTFLLRDVVQAYCGLHADCLIQAALGSHDDGATVARSKIHEGVARGAGRQSTHKPPQRGIWR